MVIKTGKSQWGRLGPTTGTICCSACIWTNIPSSNKIKTKYKKLKIIMCRCGWGKLWTTWHEETKNLTATFEEREAKARHCASPLHTISPKKRANYLSHPSRWALDPPLLLFSHNKSFKSCLTLCDPTDNSPAHQAPLSMEFPRQQILEWTDTFFSRSSWQPCCHPI